MATRSVDKWKAKKEFEILAPSMFNEKVVGITYATDPKVIPGRVIEVGLSEVIPVESRRPKTKVILKAENLRGNQVVTKFAGHRIARDFERGLVRRKTSKVYISEEVKTKDDKRLKVKAFVVTTSKVGRAVKTSLRNALADMIKKESQEKGFDKFVDEILKGQVNRKIKNKLSKIYPLRQAVIQKTEILE